MGTTLSGVTRIAQIIVSLSAHTTPQFNQIYTTSADSYHYELVSIDHSLLLINSEL